MHHLIMPFHWVFVALAYIWRALLAIIDLEQAALAYVWRVLCEIAQLFIPQGSIESAHWVHFIEAAIAVDLITSIYAMRSSVDTNFVSRLIVSTREDWGQRNYNFRPKLDSRLDGLQASAHDLIKAGHRRCRATGFFLAFMGTLLLYAEVLYPSVKLSPSFQIFFAFVLVSAPALSFGLSYLVRNYIVGIVQITPQWLQVREYLAHGSHGVGAMLFQSGTKLSEMLTRWAQWVSGIVEPLRPDAAGTGRSLTGDSPAPPPEDKAEPPSRP